jgi:hypothetical protein
MSFIQSQQTNINQWEGPNKNKMSLWSNTWINITNMPKTKTYNKISSMANKEGMSLPTPPKYMSRTIGHQLSPPTPPSSIYLPKINNIISPIKLCTDQATITINSLHKKVVNFPIFISKWKIEIIIIGLRQIQKRSPRHTQNNFISHRNYQRQINSRNTMEEH